MAASWAEWGQQKLTGWYLSRNGVTNHTLNHLEWYYFGQTPEINIDELNHLRSCLMKLKPTNLAKFMNSYHNRTVIQITKPSSTMPASSPTVLSCPVLLMVGSESPIIDQVVDLNSRLDPTQSTFMKLEECGGLLLDEKAGAVSTGVQLFLQGQGYMVHKKVKAFSSMTPAPETEKQKPAIQESEEVLV
ncbi:uncharacterized protein TRIADDRAFT_59931 [Trichoplax adhaerens]|uniref:Uncharacterized protein n=1 Tax=Trichoplax adhaerens TaxID=10228 RepID=B3S6U4_TRIAD|nr:hypothetical protein TRIADDRAFT_59931 [Trichoplax adhaerens]EDV21818.1 hypothetical protein TRIADDRAFT_59931 [Trichoplax adhaerens]|eukprot:XP_002115966.1 hypothetical protein TRIADDRAFT_59931 [Trichoplax adhaerens]